MQKMGLEDPQALLMWRRRSERGPVKDEGKEVLTSSDDGEEVRGWSDPDKEEEGGGCMGPDDGEEDGGCLDPDAEEDGGCLSSYYR